MKRHARTLCLVLAIGILGFIFRRLFAYPVYDGPPQGEAIVIGAEG